MAKRTPPFPEYPQWTTAKFWGFIRSALRTAWTRWPPKYEVVKEASIPYKGKDKRRKFSYRCNICRATFPRKEVEVDHIEPCGSLREYEDLPEFVARLFVGREKLQVVCKKCHREKTNDSRTDTK